MPIDKAILSNILKLEGSNSFDYLILCYICFADGVIQKGNQAEGNKMELYCVVCLRE